MEYDDYEQQEENDNANEYEKEIDDDEEIDYEEQELELAEVLHEPPEANPTIDDGALMMEKKMKKIMMNNKNNRYNMNLIRKVKKNSLKLNILQNQQHKDQQEQERRLIE